MRPGPRSSTALALLSFAHPGPVDGDGVDLPYSGPNIGWANALMKNGSGLAQAPLNICHSMPGMILGDVEPLFSARLSGRLRPGAAACSMRRQYEEAGVVSGGRNWQVLDQDHAAAAGGRRSRPGC